MLVAKRLYGTGAWGPVAELPDGTLVQLDQADDPECLLLGSVNLDELVDLPTDIGILKEAINNIKSRVEQIAEVVDGMKSLSNGTIARLLTGLSVEATNESIVLEDLFSRWDKLKAAGK